MTVRDALDLLEGGAGWAGLAVPNLGVRDGEGFAFDSAADVISALRGRSSQTATVARTAGATSSWS
jgi:hypothetical protein